MAMTEIPPVRSGSRGEVSAGSGGGEHVPLEAPPLLVQLQDDLARSRLREAFWMSLVLHLVLALTLINAPRFMPSHAVPVITAEDLLRNRDVTFLPLPPDEQKVTAKPDTNKISDKDRVAMSRRPTIDKKTLDELRDASRRGAPGAPGLQAPPAVAQSSAPPSPADATRPQGGGSPAPPQTNQSARLETPPQPAAPRPSFGAGAMSPGSAIEQAARAAANSRVSGFGGGGGDLGLGAGAARGSIGPMDILSDTMGVDFGPYLARVLQNVKYNWYNLIPEVAKPPFMKKGRVSIQFVILKNGSIAGLAVVSGSGDVSLDRAAYGGITSSNPFPPLPSEFHGEYLALRFHFFYNPDKRDLE
jgi:TonB family protein